MKRLDSDKEGDPKYPVRGMPESRYNPGNEDIARKTYLIKEVLTSTRDALVCFIVSLPALEQVYIAQKAVIPFLKNIDTIKAYLAAAGNKEEFDTNTVVNGEDNGASQEIPQEEENNILNQGGDNPLPMPPH